MVIEGDKAAFRQSWAGTQRGEFFGSKPTRDWVRVTEMHMLRVAGEMIVEH